MAIRKDSAEDGNIDLVEVVAEISVSFAGLTPEGLDEAITRALARIGTHVGADRSYVFLIDAGRGTMSNTHEWCAEGIRPERDNLQDIPLEEYPQLLDFLEQSNVREIPRVKDLPDDEEGLRKILEAQEIQSLILVSLRDRKGGLIGFSGFDAVLSERPWQPDHIHLLQVTCDLIGAVLENQHLWERLRESEAYNRAVSNALQKTNLQLTRVEDEQRRDLAELLHDQIGQELSALHFQLEACRGTGEVAPDKIESMIELVAQTQVRTQDLTFDLSPPLLHHLGLTAALQALARRIEREHDLTCTVTSTGPTVAPGSVTGPLLYRMARELVFNAVKHAGGSRIDVTLDCSDERVTLIVADDGCGMSADPSHLPGLDAQGGFGLFSIRQRLVPLGGTMAIATDAGTRVEITLPHRDGAGPRNARTRP